MTARWRTQSGSTHPAPCARSTADIQPSPELAEKHISPQSNGFGANTRKNLDTHFSSATGRDASPDRGQAQDSVNGTDGIRHRPEI